LGKLKEKRANLESILSTIKKSLDDQLASDAEGNIKASSQKILGIINSFEETSKKVFDLSDAFAGPEAGKLINTTLAPLESSLDAAIKDFTSASAANAEAKISGMTVTTERLTLVVTVLAILIVLAIATLGYVTVLRGIVRPLGAINGAMTKMSKGDTS